MTDEPLPDSREEIISLLNFYSESGLDYPVLDEAVNRFATIDTTVTAASQKSTNLTLASGEHTDFGRHVSKAIEMDPRKRQVDTHRPIASASANVTVPTQDVIAEAIKIADAAQDLDMLKQSIETFNGCNLKRSARSTVFEGGKRSARILLIGGAPSRDDDASGNAFSGTEGRLLDRMLGAIDLSRHNDVYFGFCVPWSPPGGVAPTPIHLEICAPFLAKQIQLAKPDIIIVMGNTAVRHVFQTKKTILQARGKWTELPNFSAHAIALCDPSMLLAQPRLKRQTWLDLLSIKSKLSS